MKIEHPKYFQDVTIEQASKFYTAHTDIEKVAAFGNDTEVLLKMKMNEVAKIAEHLDELMDNGQAAESMKFTHGGVLYGLHPDLHELEYGAYVDMGTYLETEESYWKNAAKIANVLFRRITVDAGDTYEVEEYQPGLELFTELPVIYLNAAGFFLSNLGTNYESNINNSILRLAKMETLKAQTLLKNGVRIGLFTRLRARILQRWTKSRG